LRSIRSTAHGGRQERPEEHDEEHDTNGAELKEQAQERVLGNAALESPEAVDEDRLFGPEPVAGQRPAFALLECASPGIDAPTRAEEA